MFLVKTLVVKHLHRSVRQIGLHACDLALPLFDDAFVAKDKDL